MNEPKQPEQVCEIGMFFNCAKCLEERPDTLSPAEWARLNVGWTPKGLQVWCWRHQVNVLNLDFKGQKIELAPVLMKEPPHESI